MQLFGLMNVCLDNTRATLRHQLGVVRYSVMPLRCAEPYLLPSWASTYLYLAPICGPQLCRSGAPSPTQP